MTRSKARPRAWPTLLVLGADALLSLAALELALSHGTLRYACSVLLLTLVLLHAYLVLHECAHDAVFVDPRKNATLGHLLGFLVGCPYLSRRRAHALHHAFAGHAERDPTNARAVRRLSTLSPRALATLNVLWRGWVPFLALNERIGLWRAPFTEARHSGAAAAERKAAWCCLFGYGLLLALLLWSGLLATFASLFGPAWLLLLVSEELVNLPHHLEAPFTERRLPSAQQGQVTYSCRSVPVWSRLVLLHFNLHEAHHAWPALAWHQLPDAHRQLDAEGAPSVVEHELTWSLRQRRQRFEQAFAQYIRGP